MHTQRMLVVGGGLAGLAAALHARASGFDVDLFEHHTRTGGVCTSWERDGYTIDGCIFWLMGSNPGSELHQLYREVGALDDAELIINDRYNCFIDEATGRRWDWVRDLDDIEAQAVRISPADATAMHELFEGARKLRGFDMPALNAPELMSPRDGIATMWQMRAAIPVMMRGMTPMNEWVRRIHDPFLAFCLANAFTQEIPIAFVQVVLAQLADGALSHIRGGSARFADGIAKKLVRMGGRIHTMADVEEILVENNRAVGLRLVNGETLRGDHVISAAPGHTTIFRMLGGKYTDRAIRDRYTQWPLFRGAALVSFGLKTDYPAQPEVIGVRLAEPLVVAHNASDLLSFRRLSASDGFGPAGTCVVQAMIETDFDVWHDLHHAPRRYDAAKARLAESVLARIEQHVPGAHAHLAMTDVATPYTFWRYARSYRGAFEGFMPTRETISTQVPKTLPGLGGFHMAGQWVQPGGGVPTAIISGAHAAQLACAEHGIDYARPEVSA